MKRLRIMSYSNGSQGLNALIEKIRELQPEANVMKLKKVGSRYHGNDNDVILNWGCHEFRSLNPAMNIINRPTAILVASSKIATFDKLTDAGMSANIPVWTTSLEDAKSWYNENPTETVYCRTLTQASQGRGIVVANSVDELVRAPLYTKKCNRRKEMRVHVFNGEVIDFVQKKKMSAERLEELGLTEANNDVRSHDNGWVFAREGIGISEETENVAKKAVSSLGLVFGAVDIGISTVHGVRVFEVNTAPGLDADGTTVERYAQAVIRLMES